ncbi:MAG: glycosyltransferase family 9 protein, partial [Alphaproteobacteria bacterium]
MTPRILVIKLGALGDFAQAFGPFAAIRAHHPGAEIMLLTTPPFAPLARQAPWFDQVWENGRPRGLAALWALGRRLRAARFDRVYDLQTSDRSSRYRWLVGRGVEWSGSAAGASHPHANPQRDFMHTVERQREQLEMAGISHFPAPELAWLDADITRFALPERFALLIPGASPGRPAKRWPVENFAGLAAALDIPA